MAAARWRLGLPALAVLLLLAHHTAADRHLAQRGAFVELQRTISAARRDGQLTLEELIACREDPFCAGKLQLDAQLTVNNELTVNAGGSGGSA